MTTRVLSLALVLLPALALAQKPDMSAAKKHFKSGQALMQMERWGAAIEEFKKAYEITQDGLVMGQVGQAYEKAGDYEGAYESYKVYHDSLSADERGPAKKLLDKCQKMIKEGRTKKLVLPSEAEALRKAEAAKTTSENTPPPQPEEDEEEGGRSHRLYTWIAAGAAGVLALSAMVVGLNAQSNFDQLQDECKPSCMGPKPDGDGTWDSEVDSVKTKAIVADVLWGTAAAAAVTAAVLFFIEGRSLKKEEARDPDEGEDEEDEEDYVRLRVSPMMGQGTYGLGAKLSF